MTREALIAAVLAACGGPEVATPLPGGDGAAAPITATPAGPADVVIARVDGRPIYGSCVAAQGARGRSLRQAVDECIDLELLAGAAAARGLARDPRVIEAYRTALVSRFVEVELTRRSTRVEDIPAPLADRAFEKLAWRTRQPELRSGVYVRATLPQGTPADSPDEQAARALIEEVHAEVAGRRDLVPADLFAIGERIAAARGARVDFEVRPFRTARTGPANHAWAGALFDIPAIGAVSEPVRTPWGWDVILWTDSTPAREMTRAEVLAEALPELRRAWFLQWSHELARGTRIETYPERLGALVEEEGRQ